MKINEIDRIKLLIDYNLKKTYSENLKESILGKKNKILFYEQDEVIPTKDSIKYQIAPDDPYAKEEIYKYEIDREPEWVKSYKESCGNNPNLIIPTKNQFGVEGEAAIIYSTTEHKEFDEPSPLPNSNSKKDADTNNLRLPTDDETDSLGFNKLPSFNPVITKTVPFCLYQSPKMYGTTINIDDEGNRTTGIWIPNDATPHFFDMNKIIKWVKNTKQQIVNSPKIEDENFNIHAVEKNLYSLIKEGDLESFEYNGKLYVLSIKYDKNDNKYKTTGYLNLEGKQNDFYKSPEWVDRRTAYEKFVDDYGIYVQIGAAIGVAILSIYTGGAAWVLYAEIATEGILGGIVAQREFETGKNVSGTFSLIFGLLPVAKLSKVFRGVDEETFKSLSKKLSKNPDSFKTEQEFNNFIKNTLNDDESKLLNEALKRDEHTWNELGKSLENTIMDGVLTKQLKKESLEMLQKSPNLINDITWYKRLWAREWSVNIGLFLIALVFEFKYGEKLNSIEEKKIKTIFSKIPESLQKELTYNLSRQPEIIKKSIDIISKNINSVERMDLMAKNMGQNLEEIRVVLKDSIERPGGEYLEIDEDPEKAEETIKYTQEVEKKLRDEGYVTEKELGKRKYKNMKLCPVGSGDFIIFYLPE